MVECLPSVLKPSGFDPQHHKGRKSVGGGEGEGSKNSSWYICHTSPASALGIREPPKFLNVSGAC